MRVKGNRSPIRGERARKQTANDHPIQGHRHLAEFLYIFFSTPLD